MVLLKNDGVLPLASRIAVIGPLANNATDLLGNWAGHGRSADVDVFLDGIRREFPSSEVLFAAGCDVEATDHSGFAEALKIASGVDVIIFCMGEKRQWSGENTSRSSIALPQGQEELLSRLKALGKPVVVTLTNGRPLELCRIEPLADALLETWQPGVNGASALAGILSGRINPSGKLAITFPYSTGQIPIYYNRHKSGRRGSQGIYKDITSEPLYGFGHGLSYTSFTYSDISLVGEASLDAPFQVQVSVTNTGNVDGMETVLWFVQDPYCQVITRPERELKYFEKRLVKAGETEIFRFTVDPVRDLGYLDGNGKAFLCPGAFHILAGDQDLQLML